MNVFEHARNVKNTTSRTDHDKPNCVYFSHNLKTLKIRLFSLEKYGQNTLFSALFTEYCKNVYGLLISVFLPSGTLHKINAYFVYNSRIISVISLYYAYLL